jgi:hypothetical protein
MVTTARRRDDPDCLDTLEGPKVECFLSIGVCFLVVVSMIDTGIETCGEP